MAAYHKRCQLIARYDGIINKEEVRTHKLNVITLKNLQDIRNGIVEKLKKACRTLPEQQSKLKEICQAKVRGQQSIETKLFRVLKEIGVELSSYHGESLNRKDIKKMINNATHLLDKFTSIFKKGKREDCLLSEDNINLMCLHLREVFVLWDRAFSLVRTINPTNEDVHTCQRFVLAALHGGKILQRPITPKVHAMLRHVAW